MKNIIILIFIALLIISNYSIASEININDEVKIILIDSISFSNITFKEKNDYLSIELDETTSKLIEPGKPILPIITKYFSFPLETKIHDVNISYDIRNIILNKKIQISSSPFCNSKISPKFDINSYFKYNILENSNIYPDKPYYISKGAGLYNNENMLFLKIRFNPQYNQIKNVILIPDNIKIEIKYSKPIKKSINSDNYDMVIISPNEYSQSLQLLIEHKNNIGTNTILKTTEEIFEEFEGRDEVEKIKYFIKYSIENWNIKYVLLVGGAEKIPPRYTHIFYEDFDLYHIPGEWIFPSDLYYADIYNFNGTFSNWDTNNNNIFAEYNWNGKNDEIDLYPDVNIGRLACIDTNEVEICVNKILTYEQQKAYSQNWFNNITYIGGDSLAGDDDEIDEGEYVHQKVIEILEGYNPIKIWASNNNLLDVENINAALNNGSGFVFFNGHGNLDLWGTHPHGNNNRWIPPGFFKNSHIDSLNNKNKLPIIISDACYHCTYNVKSDCFGWKFLTNPNGGSIAFLGGTDVDLSYPGIDIITKGIEKLCLELSKHYMNGTRTFGELWAKSLTSYMLSAPMDEIDIITIEESQPFGDPSLIIASESRPPIKPEKPNGTMNGQINTEYTYSTISFDPEDDNIYYLFDWGDGSNFIWIGPYDSGDTVKTNYTWAEKGSYNIRVKAKDDNGIQSGWSDPLPINMPYDKKIDILDIFLNFINQIFNNI